MNFTRNLLLILVIVALCSCNLTDLDVKENNTEYLIPKEVTIEIPGAISSSIELKADKSTALGVPYNKIRNFVDLANTASQILSKSYARLVAIEIRGVYEFAFTSTDGKTKYVSIKKNYYENGRKWDCYMEIYNESFADLALKAYWNSDKHEQHIIFKPSKLNVFEMKQNPNAIVNLEFRQGDISPSYEKSVLIKINGLTVPENQSLATDNLFVFVGKNKQILDIIGSVNTPNAIVLDLNQPKGRNWSFIGKADIDRNKAVIKLALPPSILADNKNLMVDYSLKKVYVSELRNMTENSTNLSDNDLLTSFGLPSNLDLPIYYNETGYVNNSLVETSAYAGLIDFDFLVPFVPLEVKQFNIP